MKRGQEKRFPEVSPLLTEKLKCGLFQKVAAVLSGLAVMIAEVFVRIFRFGNPFDADTGFRRERDKFRHRGGTGGENAVDSPIRQDPLKRL